MIGDHTDYHQGFVLPVAIAYDVKMFARIIEEPTIRLHSVVFGETKEFPSTVSPADVRQGSWESYFLAVLNEFRNRGAQLPGLEVIIDGDVPHGGGLSSSAAYEVAVAALLNTIAESGLSPIELALLAQSAENGPFVGMQCGIMDQYISACARESCALMIDCRSLESQAIPFDETAAGILIANSMVRRGLVESEYNSRRAECHKTLEIIRRDGQFHPDALRDLDVSTLPELQKKLDPPSFRRIRHVITENQRVLDFAEALRRNDWQSAGRSMIESHESLRDDYEVSCAELDSLVRIACQTDGVFGARMTGAGFGGCVVCLFDPSRRENVENTIRQEYEKTTGRVADIYITRPVSGAWTRELS
ncbi:MAG: galactokinase [Candidatus Sumerlaeota bacterium]|nr:galactokinase [Candidatus Sumerlaeota bacterium]